MDRAISPPPPRREGRNEEKSASSLWLVVILWPSLETSTRSLSSLAQAIRVEASREECSEASCCSIEEAIVDCNFMSMMSLISHPSKGYIRILL